MAGTGIARQRWSRSARANHMLREKVAFDDPPGLRAALKSPARHDMRADDATGRKFAGPVTQVSMHIAVVDLSGLAVTAAAHRRGA